jgi:5'-nucleotidase
MSARTSRRPLVAGLAVIAVALSGLAVVASASPAQAVSADLVISQVYGGGGNTSATYTHDYVEIYNRGDQPVTLDGKSLQYASATGTGNFGASATQLTELSGTLGPGQHFLVQEASTAAVGAPLPEPDLIDATPIPMSGTAGKVALVSGTATLGCNGASSPCSGGQFALIIDLVGFGTANYFEGAAAAPAPSNTTAILRAADGATDTDNNAADFQAGTPNPRNQGDVVEELTATDPADVTANVGTPISDINLAASGGTPPYSWDVAGLPDGLSETTDGVIGGTPNVDGTFPVTATVTDSADPVADDDATFTITVDPALAPIPIAAIQGDGAVSPLVGDPVITEGVVTAAYPSGGFFGFYLQTEGTGGSVDPATRTTSDGVFVRQTVAAGAVTVQPGDFVQVTGTVTEFAGQTQVEVTDAADIVAATGTPDPVTPITTTSWPDTNAQKEALEGMLYSPEGDFTITNTFATNQFGELGLAMGDTPLIQPTEVADAQTPEEAAVAADNAARAIVLDDASSTNFTATSSSAATCNPRPTPCLLNGNLTPPYISNDTPFRVGATGTFDDDVILTQGGSPSSPTYRFEPVTTVTGPSNAAAPATFENTRTAAPEAASIDPEGEADLKIASFNVLNYFTTLGDANDDNVGDGGCVGFWDRDGDGTNVSGGCDQRGAWDPQDLGRQQEKIVEAINSLDADVVGLMEIENSAALGESPDEATETLVAALNADAGAGTWAANPSSADLPPVSEMDVITNAIIYKPASVERTGPARALGHLSSGTDAFNNAREPIAQAFTADGSDEPILVVVNHFKSKGSGVDDGTGQGNANPDRVAQAEALRDWVPTVETDLGVDATFLLGDFNAYTMEDPMQVFYSAGYTDLAPEGEYSYSFSGLSGSLDHVVADPEALALVTGSDIWNINSGEPLPMEYSRHNYHSTDFHQPGPYRSSDHDPVVVGLDLVDEKPAATITAKVTPNKVKVDKTRAKVHIQVVGPDGAATGTVVVSVAGQPDQEVELEDGEAQVRLDEFHSLGDKVVTIEYGGDSTTGAATEQVTIQVVP